MLPKISRIRKKKDFEVIFKNAKSFRDSMLALRVMQNGSELSRFAFVVSKKISKKATVRNKIRRRLSECVKSRLSAIKPGADFVFIAQPPIEKKDFSEIKKSVESLLLKAKAI